MAAGPITTAFVDIIARLQIETSGDFEDGIRRSVSGAQRQFDRLEGVSTQTAARITSQFERINLNINVREAIADFQRVDHAAEAAIGDLRELSGRAVSIDTSQFDRKINQLEGSLIKLKSEFEVIDGETLNINVGEVEDQLRGLGVRINAITKDLNAFSRADPLLDLSQSQIAIEKLNERIRLVLRDIRTLDGENVSIRVEDLGVENMEQQLREINRQVAAASGKTLHINTVGATEGLARTSNEVSTLSKRIDEFGRVFRRSLEFAFVGLITQQLGSQLLQLSEKGLQAAGELEQFGNTFRRIFSGLAADQSVAGLQRATAASKEFLDSLKQIALTTPFEFEGLLPSAQKLLLISSSSKEAEQRLRTLADAAALLGSSSQDIEGTVRAISQLASKGKISFQDLNQIAERLPGLQRTAIFQGIIDELNILRPNLHATLGNFEELRSKGLIPTSVAVDGIFKAMSDLPGATGAAAEAAHTLTGELSNLKDLVFQELGASFKKAASELAAGLQDATDPSKISPIRKSLEDLFGGLGKTTEILLPSLLKFGGAFSDVLGKTLVDLGPGLAAITDVLTSFLTSAGPAIEGIAAGLSNIFVGLGPAVSALLEGLQPAFQVLGEFSTLLGKALGDVLKEAAPTFKELGKSIGEVFKALEPLLPDLTDILVAGLKSLPPILKAISISIESIAVTVRILVDSLEGVGIIISGIVDAASAGASGVVDFGHGLEAAATGAVRLAGVLVEVVTTLGRVAIAITPIRQLVGAIEALAEGVRKTFNELGGDLVFTLVTAFNTVRAAVEAVATGISGAFDAIGGVTVATTAVASLVFAAQSIRDAFAGILDNANGAAEQVGKIALLASPIAGIALSVVKFKDALGDAANKAADIVVRVADVIATISGLQVVVDILNVVKDAVGRIASLIADIVKEVLRLPGVQKFIDSVSGSVSITAEQAAELDNLEKSANGTSAAIANGTTVFDKFVLSITGSVNSMGDFKFGATSATDALKDLELSIGTILAKSDKLASTFAALRDNAGSGASDLLDFAIAAQEAGLNTDDLDALLQSLKSNLKPEDFGKALDKIATDFKDTTDAIAAALPPFTDAVTAAFADIKIDPNTIGLDAVQQSFNQFSLDHFIAELNKIADARAHLVENLNILSSVSAEAVRDLLKLNLDPTQLAVVTESLLKGGQSAIESFLSPFRQSDETIKGAGAELVRKLVEAGIDPALLAAIPGLTDNVAAAVAEAVTNADPGKTARFGAQQSAFNQASGGGVTTAVPGVDIPKATEAASSAGTQIAAAYGKGVSTGVTDSFAALNTTITNGLLNLSASTRLAAEVSGQTIGIGVQIGLNRGLNALTTSVATNIALLGIAVAPVAQQAGHDVASAFFDSFRTLETRLTLFLAIKIPPVINKFGDQLTELLLNVALSAGAIFGDNFFIVEELKNDLDRAIALGASYFPAFRFMGRLFALDLTDGFAAGPKMGDELNRQLGRLNFLIPAAIFTGFNIGAALGDGLVAGIQSRTAAVVAAIAAMAATAKDTFSSFFGIFSPSKVFAEFGDNLMQGLVVGILRSIDQPVKAMGIAANAIAAVSPSTNLPAAATNARPSRLDIPRPVSAQPQQLGDIALIPGSLRQGPLVHVDVDARGSNPHEVASLTAAKIDWTLSTRGDF